MATLGTRTLTSHSADETSRLGKALGEVLAPGDFVGLIGNLGAGKTQFVRGVAEGAQVPRSEVASPTFAIVYSYQGRLTLHHADLYRLGDYDELYATGFLDLLDEHGAMLVEWLDRIPQAAPADALSVRLEVVGEHERRLYAHASGAKSRSLLERWLPSP